MFLALEERRDRARKRARDGPDAAIDDFWELAFNYRCVVVRGDG